MTEIQMCPTCGRRPSERIAISNGTGETCQDPIHGCPGHAVRRGGGLAGFLDEARAEVEHQKLRGDRLAERVDRAMAERDEARALVLEMFKLNCSRGGYIIQDFVAHQVPTKYDHGGMATYEDAQTALIAWGMVKREECVRND